MEHFKTVKVEAFQPERFFVKDMYVTWNDDVESITDLYARVNREVENELRLLIGWYPDMYGQVEEFRWQMTDGSNGHYLRTEHFVRKKVRKMWSRRELLDVLNTAVARQDWVTVEQAAHVLRMGTYTIMEVEI